MTKTSLRRQLGALATRAASKIGVEIKRVTPRGPQMVSLRPDGGAVAGRVLVSATFSPFVEGEKGIAVPHEGNWTDYQMAQCFLDRRYAVDAINYRDLTVVPSGDYDFFIDCYENMERIAPLLSPDCLRIFHIQNAHWSFANWAEYTRQRALIDRRGICLPLKRLMRPHWAIEAAHCAIGHGNDVTCGTYSYARKPIYRVPISAVVSCPYPEGKDWEGCRKRFLWLGNHGFLLKGLDLVLETFERMPDYHLTVCGPIHLEKEFCEAYHKQLFETPNIETLGFVDVKSREFLRITDRCAGLIFPSASEGQCGGVVMCMQTGLIPLISKESGVDVEDFGLILDDCSPDGIERAVRQLSSLPATELEARTRRTWQFARENHTREKCAARWHFVVDQLIRAKTEGLPLPPSL